jgi:hypothetical protein
MSLPNLAVGQPAGSHAFAAAAHRGRLSLGTVAAVRKHPNVSFLVESGEHYWTLKAARRSSFRRTCPRTSSDSTRSRAA